MYTLKNNEKQTPVVIYTSNALIHGEVVTTEIVRVNIWLRTDNAPNYAHLLNAQIISLAGTTGVKTLKFDDIYVPTNEIIAYHVAPGVEIDLDYMENEVNRRMVPVQAISPELFTLKAEMRISTQTEMGVTLEVGKTRWLSLYNISISNPHLPTMVIQTPMMLIRPEKFSFGIIE